MSNYIEFDDRIIFHPGYYLKEIIEFSGITEENFANQLGISSRILTEIVNGDNDLSVEIARNLSIVLGTTVDYWINLQQAFNAMRP